MATPVVEYLQQELQRLEPYRNSNLTREVTRARQASCYDSKEVEIERLKEALDVALTMLGRNDLR